MYDYLIPHLKKELDHILIRVGTKDAIRQLSGEILHALHKLKYYTQSKLPTAVVILPQPTIRNDDVNVSLV